MATIARAKARKLGLPIIRYPKPEFWQPHFIACLQLEDN